MKNSVRKTPPAPSILIILMGSLGDIARGLCLVSQIKANMALSRVSWLVESRWAELVRLHSQIDKVIIFKRAWRLSALWDLYRDLNQEHFDIALDLQRILKSGFFALLSGARRRIGFHRRNAKEFNWLFNNEHIDYFGDDLPKIHHYLKFTAYLGLPAPDRVEFGFSGLNVPETAPAGIAASSNSFVAVVLGASWESKNWFFEGYLRLIRQILSDHKLQVVLVGDRSQVDLAQKLTENIRSPGLIDLAAKTSLTQLAAVLKAAAAGVGPDSGPGHLAAAVGTPFVSLFGPTSSQRTAPFGCEDLVVTSDESCAPCYQKHCPDRNNRCMFNISVEAAMEKLSRALTMVTV